MDCKNREIINKFTCKEKDEKIENLFLDKNQLKELDVKILKKDCYKNLKVFLFVHMHIIYSSVVCKKKITVFALVVYTI